MNEIKYVIKPTALSVLLERHRRNPAVVATRKLHFTDIESADLKGADVYNVSQEFTWQYKNYIAGRVESRQSELSAVRFFEKTGLGEYRLLPGGIGMFQDPCFTTFSGQMLIGGTAIHAGDDGRIDSWNTAFYLGKSFDDLKKVAEAPAKMKDVRLLQLDRIHVFTRPQGGLAKAGTIGYYVCDRLADVNPKKIAAAPLLSTQFPAGCWGGVNQVIRLKHDLLGIVGHIATMSSGDVRHYYGMVFAFDPGTEQATEVKIICERKDFAPGASKRPDLADVVFLGGIVRNPDGTATIYTGLSDAEAHSALIEDPFRPYE